MNIAVPLTVELPESLVRAVAKSTPLCLITTDASPEETNITENEHLYFFPISKLTNLKSDNSIDPIFPISAGIIFFLYFVFVLELKSLILEEDIKDILESSILPSAILLAVTAPSCIFKEDIELSYNLTVDIELSSGEN